MTESNNFPVHCCIHTGYHKILLLTEQYILLFFNITYMVFFQYEYFRVYIYIYIYTTSEKPVIDQSYGVLDRYGITILYK
jgi:hypothetical protein